MNTETEKPKTVKVRIAVAIGEDGAYYATGYSPRMRTDSELARDAQKPVIGRACQIYFLTATLPVPVDIEADEVERADDVNQTKFTWEGAR